MSTDANGKASISRQDFADAWNAAATVDDFSEHTGIERRIAIERATGMRRMGVKLKHMPHVRRRPLTDKAKEVVAVDRAEKKPKRRSVCVHGIGGRFCVIEVYEGHPYCVIASTHVREQEAEKAARLLSSTPQEEEVEQ